MSKWIEKDREEEQRENIDNIYRCKFPIKDIISSQFTNSNTIQLMLDRFIGIDSILQLENMTLITVQEKIRDMSYLTKYGPTLCIEYMSSPIQKGEWFYCMAHYYFLGYVNPTTKNIVEWYLVDVRKLHEMLPNPQELIKRGYLQKNTKPKRATFLALPISDIAECITGYHLL